MSMNEKNDNFVWPCRVCKHEVLESSYCEDCNRGSNFALRAGVDFPSPSEIEERRCFRCKNRENYIFSNSCFECSLSKDHENFIMDEKCCSCTNRKDGVKKEICQHCKNHSKYEVDCGTCAPRCLSDCDKCSNGEYFVMKKEVKMEEIKKETKKFIRVTFKNADARKFDADMYVCIGDFFYLQKSAVKGCGSMEDVAAVSTKDVLCIEIIEKEVKE